ncbi:MAG: PKD domain-containing protein [bacterium]
MRLTAVPLAGALLLALSCCLSCAGRSGQQPQLDASRGFSVSLLLDSIHTGEDAAISYSVSESAAQATLTVSNLPEARLKAAYLKIEFDDSSWSPVDSTTLQSGPDGRPWLGLVVPVGDGELQAGIVASGLELYGGLEQPAELLQLVFERRSGDPALPVRMMSAAPVNPGSMSALSVDQAAGKLNWEYRCSGDYDQNGLVSISDLTPLGVHFGKSGPFSVSSIESVVDGDGNGEINLGDITPIGQNFGRGVESYNIYLSANASDAPASAGEASKIAAAGTYNFGSAIGSSATQRLQFSRTSVITAGMFYWIRPVHGAAEGIASNVVQAGGGSTNAPQADLQASPSSGQAPLLVSLDASGSTDIDGDIDHYDWDFEDDGIFDDSTAASSVQHSFASGNWTVRVRVVDSGGLSDSATVAISAGDSPPQPPVAVLSADPLTGVAPLLVNLDASASTDPNADIDHYDWDFENDGTFDVTTGIPQVSRTYTGGPWTATVRVVDSGGLSDTASVTLNYTQASWNIRIADDDAPIKEQTVLVHVGGHPVIAYDEFSFSPVYDRLYVVRGTDTQGSGWTAPTRLDTGLELLGALDMDIVDGQAAVCYYDQDNGRLRYMRSTNAAASTWGSPLTLETDDNASSTYGKDCSLEVIDGVPQIAFRGDSSLRIYIKKATNATGTAWGVRSLVSSSLTGVGGITLHDAGGKPGILWSSIIQQKVGYFHASDFSGQFFNMDLYDGSPQLTQDFVYHDGRPLACYITGTPTFDVRVAGASDADGTDWGTAQVLGSASQNGCSMAVVNGIPMIVATNSGSSLLEIYRAQDAQGSSWSDAETIDGGPDILVSAPSLIEISGAPAVSYAWADDPDYQLRFALYF